MATAIKITDYVTNGSATGGPAPSKSGPLSELFATPSDTNTNFRYPADLGTTTYVNSKNHWVTFTMYDVQPANYNNTQQVSISGTTTGLAGVALLGTVAASSAAGAAGNLIVTGGKNYAVGAALGAITGAGKATPAALGITALASGLKINAPIQYTGSTISLYMPDTLAVSYSSNYEEMNLSKDLGALPATLRAIDSSVNSGITDFSKMFSNQGNDSSTRAGLLAAATNLGSAGGVNLENVATLMLKAQGLAINPQIQMIYRGTGLREFQLQFTFTPKSLDEAMTVNSIINQFRFYSSPSLSTEGSSGTGQLSMFLVPPAQFRIQFFINGSESQILPKYGNCVLTSMDVNDAPNGFAAYTDGSMVQRVLNLNFKELDILTRDYFSQTGAENSQIGSNLERR